ncbi:MAG: ABC transporter ATP-binding protein, partial [Clostridia bacterium]|nr:ABC transporter ATP-binding protein [Clostridia bacterium]
TYYSKNDTVHALQNININISRGEFVSVIGQSGSGKSTLMNILGCLDTPTSGKYLLDNIPVSVMKESQLSFIRNNIIGFIFQSFNLIPSLNAIENVELPLIYRGIKKSKRRQLAVDSLKMVGLEKRLLHKPFELSGGQQQRVAIARAVAAKPKVILADEPTGNLDISSSNEIMDILKGLHSQGATVVLITHDNNIAKMAQRCIKISDGKIYL